MPQAHERNRAAWEQLQRQGEAARAASAAAAEQQRRGTGSGQGPNPGPNPDHNAHASRQTAWEHLQRQHQAAAAAAAAAKAARDGARAANGGRKKFREVRGLGLRCRRTCVMRSCGWCLCFYLQPCVLCPGEAKAAGGAARSSSGAGSWRMLSFKIFGAQDTAAVAVMRARGGDECYIHHHKLAMEVAAIMWVQ